MMSRTTLGYFLMTLTSAAVLWGVLRYGSKLQAPPDLSGRYEAVSPNLADTKVVIQQSGVYVQLLPDKQPTRSYKMIREGAQTFLVSPSEKLIVEGARSQPPRSLTLVDSTARQQPWHLWQKREPDHASR